MPPTNLILTGLPCQTAAGPWSWLPSMARTAATSMRRCAALIDFILHFLQVLTQQPGWGVLMRAGDGCQCRSHGLHIMGLPRAGLLAHVSVLAGSFQALGKAKSLAGPGTPHLEGTAVGSGRVCPGVLDLQCHTILVCLANHALSEHCPCIPLQMPTRAGSTLSHLPSSIVNAAGMLTSVAQFCTWVC